jgi:CRISPR-associated protein Csh1
MQLYDSILSNKVISKQFVINNLLECARIQYYEKEGFNVTTGNTHSTITMGNFFIKFLENMKCLKGGKAMEVNNLKVKEEMKEYIVAMNYNEQQTAMFLLGSLIGEIGSAQRNKSSEGKKPILNKLNFAGVDKGKLVRLTGEVFNKLIQEKILKYNEGTFGECKRLMDSNFNNWKLNKQENLFYILSGYSYVTTKLINSKKDGGSKNEQ